VPTAKAAPRVSGKPVPGGRLHAAPAKWSAMPTRVVYRWQLCGVKTCTTIRGATKKSLKVTNAYVGHSLRVVAIATIQHTTVKSASRKITIRRTTQESGEKK
jgi:hypothetical protein